MKEAEKCPFRHEASALGNEKVCTFWQQGTCTKLHCVYRHMEVKKNRSMIPCFWETQPGGCRKPHCPFSHNAPRSSDEDPSKELILPSNNEAKSDTNANGGEEKDADKHMSDAAEYSPMSPIVQPVVVSINEESDTESIPTPCKNHRYSESIQVKSLEELKLEQIQKQDAALYHYDEPFEETNTKKNNKARTDLRNRLHVRQVEPKPDLNEVKVKTIEEIRAEKLAKSCKQETTEASDITTVMSNLKRTATQNHRQIRIKRPKMSSTDDCQKLADEPKQVVPIEVNPTACDSKMPDSSINDSNTAAMDESAADDFLDDSDDYETNNDMNGDDLLLEIDNILGD